MNLRASVCALVVAATGSAALADDDGFIGVQRERLEIDDCPATLAVMKEGYQPGWTGIENDKRAEWCEKHGTTPECVVFVEAGERFLRGRILHNQGDYAGAITEFVQYYCLLKANPIDEYHEVLKWTGLAYERRVEYDKAIAYYERFVIAIPSCAEGERRCEKLVDGERREMSARIKVLQQLRSVVQVATEPPGATVVISNASGPKATGRDENELSLTAGSYTLRVEKPGFEPIEKEIVVGIGRPYSFSFRLTPRKSTLRIQAIPGDAKISIDNNYVGIGAYDGEVTLGEHVVHVEAPGRLPRDQRVEVLPGSAPTVSIELLPPQQRGRTQMIVAASGVGGLLGLSAAGSATDSAGNAFVGFLTGTGVGALGGYFLVPDDLSLGESSYIITTTLAGFADGALAGGLIAGSTEGSTTQIRSVGAGAVIGATVGAAVAVLTAPGFAPSPGDAAVYNSGAVWGGMSGILFTAIFSGSSRVETAITLTGLNLGILTGGLIASRYDFSRRRVVYIDLAGAAGLTIGAAISAGASSATEGESSGDESTAHFTLAGMAVGLGVGAWLTRNMDLPALPTLAPRITPGKDAAGGSSWMLSVGGSL